MKTFLYITTVVFLCSVNCLSQTDDHHLHKGIHNDSNDKFYLKFDNDADSLIGFNREAALSQARINAVEDWKQKRYLASEERRFIDFKYNLRPAPTPGNPTVQAPCTNPDFETGTIAGWTLTQGPNNNSLTMAGCCPSASTTYQVVSPGTDPNVPLQMVPPGTGNFTCRFGNTTTGATAYRLSQTFNVTAANSVFIFRYAVVLQDGSHTCAEQPYFNVRLVDCSNNPIPCASFNATAPGASCANPNSGFVDVGAWQYRPWTTAAFDLTPYIGGCVTLEFTVAGCVVTQGAHAGYCYVDASCQPMALTLNGTTIPVGQTNSYFCNGSTNQLCGPAGYAGYTWTGPGVTGQTGQCVSVSTAGSYSVALSTGATGGCLNPVLYSNFAYTPGPTADFTFTTTPCQTTFTVPFQSTSNPNSGPPISGYTWTWGDATPAGTNASETHTFATSGTKTVKLKITNGSCVDSITKTINVTPKPVANFNLANGCLTTASNFTSTSTPVASIVSQVWNWGDATANGSGASSSHAYGTSGSFPVKLVVTDAGLCKDSITKTIVIFPNPVITFTAGPVCFNTPVTFTNTSAITPTATITGWAWDFDTNGTTDNTTQSPTNNYAAPGTYTVSLKATSNNGCTNTGSITVTVNALPTATFTPANACVNANISLNNTSSVPAPATLANYSWTFGAGSNPATSSNQNPPSLDYGSSGIKTITLTITANTTCTATITKTVSVYPSPTASFSTSSVCQATATAFTDLSTAGTGTVNTWNWDYTNNGSIDNTTQNPSFVFPASGTYTTSLQVATSNGCTNTFTLPVNVWGHAVPDFSPNNVCYGTATTFTNLTNVTSNTNLGGTPGYTWAFADGSANSTALNPIHSYTLGANGNAVYNVTLTAITTHSCTDYIVKPVNVYSIPTAAFTSNTVCLGSPTTLTDASNGNGNPVNGYLWDFLSNGTVDATNVSTANYTFPAYGTNLVSYTVSTTPVAGLTCSNSTSTLTVYVNPGPVPDFTFVNNCINAQPNTFDGSVSTIPVGSITNYAWAFGDAGTSSSATSTVTHSYVTPAIYNVTLTLTSAQSCTASVVKPVQVYQKPIMSIAHNAACDGSAMSFTAVPASNSGTVTDWYWDYNNSINTIEANGQPIVSYTFPGPGAQTVALVTVSSPGQCRDTTLLRTYVNYVPAPAFTAAHPNGCPVHCDTLLDNTPAIPLPGKIVSWNWNFGNGDSTQATSGVQQISCYDNSTSDQLKFYSVKLVTTTDSGCTNVIQKNNFITIYPTPIASYTINPDPGSVVEPLEYFINNSRDYTKWYWTFGDNTPFKSDSTHVSPTHFYNNETAQTYYTNLIVVNQYGCSDTTYVPIDIGPDFAFYIPNAFTPANSDGVNDLFTGNGIGIVTYDMWIFDRWGEMIFYSNDITKGWNGKKSGKSNEVQQDVYIWKVKLKDVLGKNHEYIGHVTLLR